MRLALVATWLICVPLFGCDDEKPKAAAPTATATVTPAATAAAPKPSATAAPSASAAADLPKCPAGLTGNALPEYCIKLPGGYAVKDARTLPERGSISYETGSPTESLMISYDSKSVAEQSKEAESEMKFGGDKISKQGNLPGGGKWYEGTHQEYSRLLTVVKGKPPLSLKCSFTFKTKSPPAKEALDVCRSIVLP
ncbi:MAG: hypothetical protein IPI67_37110 [Myxococcales bacterium]|nr:hypothetical protein [Myxococcales bacterium]